MTEFAAASGGLLKDMNPMTQDRCELIAAFADGERVDTNELRVALADDAGREYLIELVAMREIVKQTGETPVQAGERMRPTDDARPAAPTRDGVALWGRSMTGLAAALAMAVGLAGYAIGQQRSQIVPVAVLPPLEADVIVTVETAPAPTQVIRLDGGSGPAAAGGR